MSSVLVGQGDLNRQGFTQPLKQWARQPASVSGVGPLERESPAAAVNPRIVEVAQHWPPEIFIQRHLRSMCDTGANMLLVARDGNRVGDSASLASNAEKLPGAVMPDFDGLSTAQKVWNLRYHRRWRRSVPLRKSVLLGYFEHLRPKLIHFHTARLAAALRWIPLGLEVPYTLSLRGSDLQVDALRSSARRSAIVAAIEGATGIHSVCTALGQRAAGIFAQGLDFSVIYTTVPFPSTMPPRQRTSTEEMIHFVSVGRLTWHKGFHHLLVALHRLRAKKIDARLTIVGIGTELEHLLYLRHVLDLESAVNFPGKLSYEQVLGLFGDADGFVQASVAEGLSNALAEAMANGVPVFATDVGGTREVIEDESTGILLPALTPESWAERLLKVRDAKLMERIRRSAYEKATRLFGAERHASDFSAFFASSLHAKPLSARLGADLTKP